MSARVSTLIYASNSSSEAVIVKDEDELTDEEVEAILQALDSYDEVHESEVELEVMENSVDEEHKAVVRKIFMRRLPCTSHKVLIFKFILCKD